MRDALKRIEALGAGGDVAELAGWLANDDWQVRRAAVESAVARALAPGAAGRDELLELLVAALHSEENAGLRNAAQEALTRIAPHAAPRLAREAAGASADVKILIAPVLGESGSAEAAAVLLDLARSDDLNVATAAIIGLGRLRRREGVATLLELVDAGDPWLAFPSVEALGVIGDPRAVGALAARLDDPMLGASALEALVRVGSPEAARALAARLFDGGPRPALLEAIVRIARERLPEPLARAARAGAVDAFRAVYAPEQFDALAELARGGSGHAEAALEALGWTGDARALPILLVALARPATQESAAAGIGAIVCDPAVAGELRGYTEHMSAPARLELARAVASEAPVEAARLLSDLLADAEEEVWRDAVEVASEVADRLGERDPCDPVAAREVAGRVAGAMDLLEPEARLVATRLLERVAAAGSLGPELLDGHAGRLVEHPDLDVRLAGAELQAIVGRLSPRAREALDEALHSGDPFARLRAVEIASASGLPELRGLFATALADEEPLVRRGAVEALAAFDDEEALAALRTAAVDGNDLVAADALAVLAARGGAEGESILMGASRSDRALLRCIAAERLAGCGGGARRRVLEMAAGDPDFEVRRAAVAALRGTEEAREAVAAALGDRHHSVRHAGLRLAAAAADPGLAPVLEAIADADDSDDARGEALVALAACAPEVALERAGRALLDPHLAPYAMRALERVAVSDAGRLRRYRDAEAPPRVALAVDALLAGLP